MAGLLNGPDVPPLFRGARLGLAAGTQGVSPLQAIVAQQAQAQQAPPAPAPGPAPQGTGGGGGGGNFLERLFGGYDDPNLAPEQNALARRQALQNAGLALLATTGNGQNVLANIGNAALGTRQTAEDYRKELQQKAALAKLTAGGVTPEKLSSLYEYAVQTGDEKLANSAVGMLNALNGSRPSPGAPHYDAAVNPKTGKPEQYRIGPDGALHWLGVAPVDTRGSGSTNLARVPLGVEPEDARRWPELAGKVGQTYVFSVDPKTNAKLGTIGPVPQQEDSSTRYSTPKLYRDATFQNPDGTFGANVQVSFDRQTGQLVNAATGQPVRSTNLTSPFTARQDQGIQMIRAAGTTLDRAQPLSVPATKFVLNAGEDLNHITSVAGYTALSDADKETVVSSRQFVDGMIDLMNVARPNIAFQMRLLSSVAPQAGDTPRILAQKALLRHTIGRGDLSSAFDELQAIDPALAGDARHLLSTSGSTGNVFLDEGR